MIIKYDTAVIIDAPSIDKERYKQVQEFLFSLNDKWEWLSTGRGIWFPNTLSKGAFIKLNFQNKILSHTTYVCHAITFAKLKELLSEEKQLEFDF